MKTTTFYSIMLFLLISLAPFNAISQQQQKKLPHQLAQIARPDSREGWIRFNPDVSINPETFFIDYRDALGLSADDNMQKVRTKFDELGFAHYHFQQYHKNIKVVFGEYKLHQRPDGFVKSANGRLIIGIQAPHQPLITEEVALQAALQFMNARKYLWQNEILENELKRTEKNQQATYYPKGELVFAPSGSNMNYEGSSFRLAWKFNIYTDDPEVMAKTIYIDALTGNVNYYQAIAMNCSNGSGNSAFNGNVTVYTFYTGSTYRSHNDCQATDIRVYNCAGGGATSTYYTDTDNNWANLSGVQCMWGSEKTYAYFNVVHSRQSWDGLSGDMISYNNAFAGQNNACWGCTGNSAIFYAGSTGSATDDWNTNDIVGHEFGHGVTQAESNLVYEKEPGALNESFSDIFGDMVESFSEGINDWLVGADRGAIRSFINPNSFSQPDTYLGNNWVSTSCSPSQFNDFCGVHTNSGVQNFWFYLLSEGGSGTNDNGTAYNVSGISRFSARLIAYRNNAMYLTSSSQYIDARDGSLDAAEDLYGNCSNEYIQCGNAWYAVGVGPSLSYYNNNLCGTWPWLGIGGDFKGINTITAANGCTTTIVPHATASVSIASPNRAVMYPGFIAQQGSHFTAYIDPCAVSFHRTPGEEPMSEAEKNYMQQIVQQELVSEWADTEAELTPNPFQDHLELGLKTKAESLIEVILTDASGRQIETLISESLIKAGNHRFSFHLASLAPGVYMLQIQTEGGSKLFKLVKVN
ncbi:MAG: M4 family metallopeptidase [Bacteroidia bacterium]|nr:M4 family metallopeptidase [Bacteroidia bacterium]